MGITQTLSGDAFGVHYFFIYFEIQLEITFKNLSLSIGSLKEGKSSVVLFPFTNTGEADLIIQIVTSYKCTDIEYSRRPLLREAKVGPSNILQCHKAKGQLVKALERVFNTNQMLEEAEFAVFVE